MDYRKRSALHKHKSYVMIKIMKTLEEKEAARIAKAEAKTKAKALQSANQPKEITRFEDIDSSAMVNIVKAHRAFKAVFGGAKGGTAEIVLAQRLAGQFPNKEELVIEVYKGLKGLLNPSKAMKNRENEAKDRARKASK